MKLPRLLIILLVVLVVLQVASCGVAALRMDEGVSPDGIPELLQDVGPEPAPVDRADVAACETIPASGIVAFPGACRIVVEPASGSVRRLTLEHVGGGPVAMRLTADPERVRDLDVEDVDVPPDERIEVDLECRALPPCQVRVGG
jgi:hypothetical protein